MLEAMRSIGLDYLIQELADDDLPFDSEAWYRQIRSKNIGKIFPYLVEDSGKVDLVFILSKVEEDLVKMSVQEIKNDSAGCSADKVPFMKPSGSQSPQVGPVIKRSYNREKGAGPSAKILNTTINEFIKISKTNKRWSGYFGEIVNILFCSKICLPDQNIIDWQEAGYDNLLECAINEIGPQSNTVFLTVRDGENRLPGENPDYIEYLLIEKLAGERYVTQTSLSKENEVCPLCNAQKTTVFPNALKGAGINFINVDRAGVFAGIKQENAWKGFALCAACADLLYIYKNHVLKKGGYDKKQQPFGARVAGEQALLIPHFLQGINIYDRFDVLEEVYDYINNLGGDVSASEDCLLEVLKDNDSILNLDIIWAVIGQNIDDITGMITSVLPSRLRELSEINAAFEEWQHPLFPKVEVNKEPNAFKPNLALTALKSFFWRPGGMKARSVNNSAQLFKVKRVIAACVYYQRYLSEPAFWKELLITARWYLAEAIEKKDGYKGLLYEGLGKKGSFLTAAGWIRHINWWLYYFKEVGILPKEQQFYKPQMIELEPFFGPESGIDGEEKAFAFLLGVLYGKVMEVQGAKGFNVGANALTWLKRLTLKGKDLPELYVKVREKLLAYETEKSSKVRQLVSEIGVLGTRLGDNIQLNEVQTNYYLLLGQSMMTTILPKGKKENE
jgi:CRISPR-associated protein Csh1